MILGVMEGSQKTGIFLAGSCRISRSPSEREREREETGRGNHVFKNTDAAKVVAI